ncbi:transcription factor RelB isoform X2 [Micropterus dolomieu]|uniref:transcription factor RelB isoform X2 n=1 Tax=Micropterus dolomieu TaxID=147949 RepID=UPI001E8CAFE9|nr:transcription factor RelB isoform X2 [Micropterus dolomieu]
MSCFEERETSFDLEQKTENGKYPVWKEFKDATAEFTLFKCSSSHTDILNMKDTDILNGNSERGVSDIDLIQEIIREDGERSGSSLLPGPPSPPPNLRCQPNGQNQRSLRRCSSPSSEPVLLARGTPCQPTCTFPQPLQQFCTSREMAHPSRGAGSSRRGRGSSSLLVSRSCGSVSSLNRGGDAEMLERILEKPKLVVVEEPKERGMRFRYECEGRSAGSILGASSTETNKTQPAIEIQGPIDHLKKVTVTASLVTKDLPHRPHPHCLVGKDCPNGSGICVVSFNPHSNRRHSFANLGIQCVRRKELDVSLQKRRNQNIDPFQTGHSKGIEDMDMNAVRLCFQCDLEWEDGRKDSLNPVVSSPIYDKKATTTSQLKISCLNQYRGSCAGKTEIYMLCDKVQKDDIEIIFRRGSWKASGEFAQTDVHRQIAIVFKTPPYQDQDITEEVEVSVALRRLSDQMESEPVSFTYLPHNPDPYEVNRKRKIKSDISLREKPCVTESAPAAEQPFHFPQPPTMMSPDERLCTALPVDSPLGQMCYNEPPDSSTGIDPALLNQLLEMPAFLEMLDPHLTSSMLSSFEQGADANSTFANTENMDMNYTQNFGSYTQDFSHYSDLQFNMLVNESQTPQSEAQDSSSNIVQVKTEEEL